MRTLLSFTIVVVLAVSAQLSSAQDSLEIPPTVVESWSYLIGNWTVEGRVGDVTVEGSATFEWAADRTCYLGRQVWKIGENGRSIQLALLGGWDAAEKQTIEQGFSSAGGAATVHYASPADETKVIEGRIDGVRGPGARWSGTIKLQRNGPDEFQLTTTIDGEVVHSLKYVRNADAR